MMNYPRAIDHMGVGVSDVEKAIDWYQKVFGFQLLRGPFVVDALDGSYGGTQAGDVLGSTFRRMRMAHLTTANGIGFELFEMLEPPHERRHPSLEYWKNGIFHYCLTDPHIAEMVDRIVEHGGQQLSRIWPVDPEIEGFKICYCQDFFGNIVEIYTHSYDQIYGGTTADPHR